MPRRLAKVPLNLARGLAIMQLHPVEDDPEKLVTFTSEYPDHDARGFVRIMFVVGSLRDLSCLDYFRRSKNQMETL